MENEPQTDADEAALTLARRRDVSASDKGTTVSGLFLRSCCKVWDDRFRRSLRDTQKSDRLDLSSTAPMIRHSVSFASPMRRATNARRPRSVSKSHDILLQNCARSDLSPRNKRKSMSGYFEAKERGSTTNLVGRSSACGGAACG